MVAKEEELADQQASPDSLGSAEFASLTNWFFPHSGSGFQFFVLTK